MIFLEFEKPLELLYQQLETLHKVGDEAGLDVKEMSQEIELKIEKEREKIYSNLSGWHRVQLSRHPERPYTLDYIRNMCDSFIELHGDRYYGDDKAIVSGIATIEDKRVAIIGHQKGANTKLRKYRNFGMAQPEGYRKALRIMKLAERFKLPIINLIDTPGAYPGVEAEERGQAEAIAKNLFEMAQLEVPIICYIIGEGASGGAIGIGVGDRVFMLENTWYSVISPESCSSILWRSWDYKEQAAEALKLTAEDMHGMGLVDGIIQEPVGGAHSSPQKMYDTLKKHILKEIDAFNNVSTEDLLNNRIDKYSAMGEYIELSPEQMLSNEEE